MPATFGNKTKQNKKTPFRVGVASGKKGRRGSPWSPVLEKH